MPTGTEGYSYHLIQALVPRLLPMSDVRLYFRAPPPDGTFPNAEHRVIPFPRLWTHLRLSWEMVRQPPDLLFVPAHVLPLVRPRRTIVTIHDLGYRYFPEAHPPAQRLYLHLSTRWNAQVADHVIADSKATQRALVREYNVPSEKVTVIHPGYDRSLHPLHAGRRRCDVLNRYNIEEPYILYLGRIQPRKNLVRLVDAFMRISPDHPDLMLVLAGPTGWLADPIRTRVEALGLRGRVHFPGYIRQEDKAALISGALCFAFPSLYEGFGFPVLEAQACGVPILTSNTSSLPEVAGEGALLVSPVDTEAIAQGLLQLLEDNRLRARLVVQGELNLTRFSWERAARQVTELIEKWVTN
jgi:glycosyltransferase involved in cell wall biosynthesis